MIPPRYELRVEPVDGIEFRLPYIAEADEDSDERAQLPSIELIIDGKRYSAQLMQNLEAIARENLEDQRSRYMLRCLGSEVLRGLARDAVSEASKSFGIFGMIAGAIVNATVFDRPDTDLRAWMSLPRRIYLARIPIEPGQYQPVINVSDSISVNMDSYSISENSGMQFIFVRI